MDKEQIKNAITSIANIFTAKSDKEADDIIAGSLNYIKENNIKTPEDFDLIISHKINNCLKRLAVNIGDLESVNEKNKAAFIYTNYMFLEQNIRQLCTQREGTCCCVDKSRYILEIYLKYVVSGEIPEFDPNKEKFYIPKFGTNEMWIAYCNGLYDLYFGHSEKYLSAYKDLVICEIRRFPHIVHYWHIKYKNGEDFNFFRSFDDNKELRWKTINNCYVMPKDYVGTNKFEKYKNDNDEFGFLYRNCYLVPINEVEVYSVDEEEML